MMKKYLSLFFILLSMACGKKNQITELKMPSVIHLTGEKVETILPRCYETGVLVDSFLVLKENCTDTLFYLFSAISGQEVFRFGDKGRGVCEFYYPLFLSNSFAYDSLIIYDIPVGRLTKIDLHALVENQDIRYNQQVISIDVENRLLRTSKGDEYQFDRLISSLPLPEVIKMLKNVPVDVCNAVARLHCTCGYQISVGLKTKNIPPYLWWYIYDEDILPARVYSPSLKSPDNVPEGCSSLQMEVYCNRNEYTREELLARSVGKLVSLNILKQEDILFTDIRFEPYANVIFDHNIYEARKTVRDYLFSLGIETIGRFGKWGYLWSDQSLMSGLKVEM